MHTRRTTLGPRRARLRALTSVKKQTVEAFGSSICSTWGTKAKREGRALECRGGAAVRRCGARTREWTGRRAMAAAGPCATLIAAGALVLPREWSLPQKKGPMLSSGAAARPSGTRAPWSRAPWSRSAPWLLQVSRCPPPISLTHPWQRPRTRVPDALHRPTHSDLNLVSSN